MNIITLALIAAWILGVALIIAALAAVAVVVTGTALGVRDVIRDRKEQK